MAKSPAANQPSTDRFASNIVFCVILSALPVAAALLPQIWVEFLVPRNSMAEFIKEWPQTTSPKTPKTVVALYHYAVAAAFTVAAAVASLWYSLSMLRGPLANKDRRMPSHVKLLLVAALAIASLCLISRGVVDDTTTVTLFKRAGLASVHPEISLFFINIPSASPFDWDGRILGFATYLAFAVAAVTCAAAATSAPNVPPRRPATAEDKGPAIQRMTIVRTSLFFATGVLLVSMVTAKIRFDVGLAALGGIESGSEPAKIYADVANAINAYWSVVLSLALAALYVPPAVALYPPYLWEMGEAGSDKDEWFGFSKENITRVLRLAAIVSPPVIAQVIKVFTG